MGLCHRNGNRQYDVARRLEKNNNAGDDLGLVGDFAGLVAAILNPETNNAVNNSNIIYKAVQAAMSSGKRPSGHAPILHCSVNSISGGTMSEVAENANSKLNEELQFFFEADPNDNNRLFFYMYYGKDIDAARKGEQITVYKQVFVRENSNAVWKESGTYLGYATVGDYYGGGNNGKSVRTVDAYSWKAGALAASEDAAN